MSFPLRIPDQLKQHLRALRKSRGLTQGQLGALVGVRQARIAEIEANPGAVSLDQITKVLAALGGCLHLISSGEGAGTGSQAVPDERAKSPQSAPVTVAKRAPKPSSKAVGQVAGAPIGGRSPTRTTKPASVTGIVIRPKKGTW